MSKKRPNQLQTKGLRSLSPTAQFTNNISETHLSPHSPSSVEKPDSNDLRKELFQKNGVLLIDNKEIRTRMDEFVIEGSLGNGTCGNVYRMKIERLPNVPMAVKQMRPSSHCFEENKRIFRDLYVVTRCQDCPFIVTCYGIFISQSDVWICMEVMETCLDKLLKFLNQPFPEFVIGKLSCAIIKALQYLKTKHNIMHRDIKPSNMLLSNRGEVKLCDFGICAKLKDSIANSRQPGCIGYMAPERLKSSTYDVRADVWSLGMSLVELASGRFPIDGHRTEFEIIACIIDGQPPTLPRAGQYTPAFEAFVYSCLQKDFNIRPKYDILMSREFYMRHNVEPLDILVWHTESVAVRKQELLREQESMITAPVTVNPGIYASILPVPVAPLTSGAAAGQPAQPSSGYSSACSDSSSGGSPTTAVVPVVSPSLPTPSSAPTAVGNPMAGKRHRTYVLRLPPTSHEHHQHQQSAAITCNRSRRPPVPPVVMGSTVAYFHGSGRSLSQPPRFPQHRHPDSSSNTPPSCCSGGGAGARFLMLETDL